ncbi:hypothetical protein GOODEAATRI_022377 [Goodea atripinnis]|uniref:Uncharacterized protein n=1 Tax=Goodea atripinnis TaxID=208336 RepID=A0ABV0MX96_9TELE
MAYWWSAWSWWMAWSTQRKGWSQQGTGRCVLQLRSVWTLGTHLPPTGGHSREYQHLRSLPMQHQAKELGGVVKCSLAAGDWQDTSVTNLRINPLPPSLFSGCISLAYLGSTAPGISAQARHGPPGPSGSAWRNSKVLEACSQMAHYRKPPPKGARSISQMARMFPHGRPAIWAYVSDKRPARPFGTPLQCEWPDCSRRDDPIGPNVPERPAGPM